MTHREQRPRPQRARGGGHTLGLRSGDHDTKEVRRPQENPGGPGAVALSLQRQAGNRATGEVLRRRASADGGLQRQGDGPGETLIAAGRTARDLRAFSVSLRDTADKFDDMGAGILGTRWGQDEGALVAASKLSDAASSLAETANLLQRLGSGEGNELLGTTSSAYGHLSTMLEACELVRALHDDSATQAFLANPDDAEAAAAWGRDAASTFTTASNLVAALPGGLPVQMMAGYLSAPAHYVEAFTAIMRRRDLQIQELTGHRPSSSRVHGHDWIGELSPVYARGVHSGLARFMREHRNVGGVDLEQAPRDVSVPHLRGLIERAALDPSSEAHRRRDTWLGILSRY